MKKCEFCLNQNLKELKKENKKQPELNNQNSNTQFSVLKLPKQNVTFNAEENKNQCELPNVKQGMEDDKTIELLKGEIKLS